MTVALTTLCALLGLVVGSFLNVVIHRVPLGQSVLRPRSACPACGRPVRWRDNIPVLGYLLLRGRCRDCGASIGRRYPLVELGTCMLFAVLAVRLGPSAELPAYLYLAAVGLALAVIDIDEKRLPDALTLPSYGVGVTLLAIAAVAAGSGGPLWRALAGGAAMFAAYLLLRVAYPPGMGWGDVKLAGVLGLYLGWIGWGAWAVGLFLSFTLGGLFGLLLIVLRRGGRKTKVPFGPFMLLGTLIGILAGPGLAAAYVQGAGLAG